MSLTPVETEITRPEVWAAGPARSASDSGDPLGDLLATGEVDAGADHAELVASDAAAEVLRPARSRDRGGHRLDDAVAGLVAEPIVEDLEVVEIDRDQRHRRPVELRSGGDGGEALVEPAVIGHARERIGVRIPDGAQEIVTHLRRVSRELAQLGRPLRRERRVKVALPHVADLGGEQAQWTGHEPAEHQQQREAQERRAAAEVQRGAHHRRVQPLGRPTNVVDRRERAAVARHHRHEQRAIGGPGRQLSRALAAGSALREPELHQQPPALCHRASLAAHSAQRRLRTSAGAQHLALGVEDDDAVEAVAVGRDDLHDLRAQPGDRARELVRSADALLLGRPRERGREQRQLHVPEDAQRPGRKQRRKDRHPRADRNASQHADGSHLIRVHSSSESARVPSY
jgi:hypothetical protein